MPHLRHHFRSSPIRIIVSLPIYLSIESVTNSNIVRSYDSYRLEFKLILSKIKNIERH